MKGFFKVYFVCCLTACFNSGPIIIKTDTRQELKEVRLGTSNYYLRLPSNFEISEARGKEGQLGYNIFPQDTSARMSGFIEIEQGHPVGGTNGWGKEIDKVQSAFLNGQTMWTVSQTETRYFVAETQKGEVRANALSNKRNEVDSLISIIATLTRK